MDSNNCSNDSESVREFLRQLDDLSDTAMIPAVVMLVIFSVVGLAGKILVLVVYSKKVQLSPTKVLIMTIATFDLVGNVGAIPSEQTMDSYNCSNDSESVREFLRQLNEKSSAGMIPAVVMLVIFSVVGLVGNILVLVVYSKKVQLSPTKVLIMTIASFDLVTNTTAIPSIITINFNTWDFNRPTVCQWISFIGCISIVGSALCLVFVAVIRYRKVCRPHGWQVTIRQAVIACITIAILALIISLPYFVLSGVRTRPTSCPNIKGHDCFFDDRYLATIWPILTGLLFMLLFIFSSVSMVVMYTLIGVMAWKHGKFHGVHKQPNKTVVIQNFTSQMSFSTTVPLSSNSNSYTEQTNPNHGDTEIETPLPRTLAGRICLLVCKKQKNDDNYDIHSTVPATQNHLQIQVTSGELIQENDNISLNEFSTEEVSQLSYPNLQIDPSTQNSNPKNSSGERHSALHSLDSTRMKKTQIPLGRMTAMLIIISAIYVLGFLLYLILNVYKENFPERYATLNQLELAVFNIAYRVYFLQSATNPIVYSFCDTHFRRKCIHLLRSKHDIPKQS